MVDVAARPPSPAMRFVRVGFACLLIFALVFSIVMAAWGDMRDALFVRFLDTRFAKSFVIRAPQGAKVWLGDKLLGLAQLPIIADTEPEAVIDGLTVREARVYAEEKEFLKQSLVIEPGATEEFALGKLAPGRRIVHGGGRKLDAAGLFLPVLMAEDKLLDAALLCTLEIPRREGGSTLFAFLLRIEHEGVRCFEGGDTKIRTTQLSANTDDFWTTREEYPGLPRKFTGQMRTSWLLWPRPVTSAEQAKLVGGGEPKWVELPQK